MMQIGGVLVNQSKCTVVVDGKTYKFPKGVKGYNITTINSKVYIDGFELKNGVWKRTLKALYHRFF